MPILYSHSNLSEFFEKKTLGPILVVDVRLQEKEYNTIFEQPHLKPMLAITEPIQHFGIAPCISCKYSYNAFIENKFPYLFGCHLYASLPR